MECDWNVIRKYLQKVTHVFLAFRIANVGTLELAFVFLHHHLVELHDWQWFGTMVAIGH